jgi:hypothetical protein
VPAETGWPEPSGPNGANGNGSGSGRGRTSAQRHGTDTERYLTQPVRPAAQLAARVGLWSAVALGCVGGCVGLVKPAASPSQPAVQTDSGSDTVPAPVAGVAQIAVRAWLSASSEDRAADLDKLFVDPPSPTDIDTTGLRVVAVTPVSGRRIAAGYWSVTVAAELTDDRQSEGNDGGIETTRVPVTWYVEIGVVGQIDGGLSALTTPAVVPPPAHVGEGYELANASGRTPDNDDPMVSTVNGFLSALLVGKGDPGRYVSPGVKVDAIQPSPFAALAVVQMAVVDLDGGEARAWAHAQVTTAGGARQVLAYELLLHERAGRWEVADFAGVPSLSALPDPKPETPTTEEPKRAPTTTTSQPMVVTSNPDHAGGPVSGNSGNSGGSSSATTTTVDPSGLAPGD